MKLRLFILFVMAVCTGNKISAQGGTWMWVNGSDTLNSGGTYGTMGIASVLNSPPGLVDAAQWADKQGNFWVYGGITDTGNALAGDVWKFNPVANTWTWVKSTPHNAAPTYGTQGVPSSYTSPGARYGATTWTDSSGDLWLFGGISLEPVGISGERSDLWKYHIETNEWTWMSGSDEEDQINGSHSTFQSFDTGNLPWSRWAAISAWVDSKNRLWLFGGVQFDIATQQNIWLNDIWCYDISSGLWAWMNGPHGSGNVGNYGTMGIESPFNSPPPRESYTHWLDSSYLYIWGGGYKNTSYSDVWRFNLNNYNWTWIAGPDVTNSSGIYHQFCLLDDANQPESCTENRSVQITGCANTFLTFGGSKNIGGSVNNDLWRFDVKDNNWTWMTGFRITDTFNYGTKGVPSLSDVIPARGGVCMWIDAENRIWVFGGSNPNGQYNDVWEFFPDSSCLGLITNTAQLSFALSGQGICRGDSVVIILLDDSDVTITPSLTVNWADSIRAFLKPDSTTTYHITGFNACDIYVDSIFTIQVVDTEVHVTASNLVICASGSSQICAPTGFTSYLWSTGDTSACLTTANAGIYTVTISENGQCTAASNQITLSTYTPLAVTINITGDTLTCVNTGPYQWYCNGQLLINETNNILIATHTGIYTVSVKDQYGCYYMSSPVLAGIDGLHADDDIKIFPNPSTGTWQLAVDNILLGNNIQIFNTAGQLVYQSEIRNNQSEITVPNGASGIYELRIISPQTTYVTKLVKI